MTHALSSRVLPQTHFTLKDEAISNLRQTSHQAANMVRLRYPLFLDKLLSLIDLT